MLSPMIAATVLVAPQPRLDITEEEEGAIHMMLRLNGAMTAEEVASLMRLDESEVAVYLANQTGLGYLDHRAGRYSAWHWL
jgi:hypothetical protein